EVRDFIDIDRFADFDRLQPHFMRDKVGQEFAQRVTSGIARLFREFENARGEKIHARGYHRRVLVAKSFDRVVLAESYEQRAMIAAPSVHAQNPADTGG